MVQDNHPPLRKVPFPAELRRDGRASTYVDSSGELYIEPAQTAEHDFGFSDYLDRNGLSVGEVAEEDGAAAYVHYKQGADLISLSSVLNSSLDVEDGEQDVRTSLVITAQTLTDIKKVSGALPLLSAIGDVAIDRSTGRAEILPPYQVSAVATVMTVLEALQADAIARSPSSYQKLLIGKCFAAILGQVEMRNET